MKKWAWLAPLIQWRAWLAPVTGLWQGHTSECSTIIILIFSHFHADKNHLKGSRVTSAVVTAAKGAQHGNPAAVVHQVGPVQPPPAARHGVPNEELAAIRIPKKDAAMAAVPRKVVTVVPFIVGNAGAEFCGGREARDGTFFAPVAALQPETTKEARHGRSSMVVVVATAEARAGEEAEPELAGEGGAHEREGDREGEDRVRGRAGSV